jgi:hypothetical protein
MKCSCCGDKIKGEPVWVGDDAYCCDACADVGYVEEEELEEEEEKQ